MIDGDERFVMLPAGGANEKTRNRRYIGMVNSADLKSSMLRPTPRAWLSPADWFLVRIVASMVRVFIKVN